MKIINERFAENKPVLKYVGYWTETNFDFVLILQAYDPTYFEFDENEIVENNGWFE